MIWSPKVAAVQIGNRAVRLALVRTGPARPRVIALVEKEIMQRDNEGRSAATVRALKDALEELEASADVYVSNVSGRNALVRVISVPFVRRRQVETTVKFELEPHVPLPIDDLVVDFSPISVSDGKTQVLAVAVKRNSLRDHLETLAEAGIDPEIVDLDFAPLTSLWLRENSVRENQVIVLVHAAADRSQVVILEGRKMIYLRSMDLSAQDLQEDVHQTAEQLLTTLRAFAATSRRSEIDRLVVTGASLSTEQCATLERRLGLSVSACKLGTDLISPDKATDDTASNAWAALIGSAVNYGGKARAGFNFRKEEFACRGAVAGVKKHAAFSGALVVLLLLASLGHLKSQIRMRSAERDALESRMVELFTNATGQKPRRPDKVLAEMQSKEGPLKKRQEEYEMYRPYVAGTASALDVLNEIITLIPDSRGLAVTELSVRGAVVTVVGEAADAAEVEATRNQLDSSELLRDVRVVEQASSRDTDKIDFTISGTRS